MNLRLSGDVSHVLSSPHSRRRLLRLAVAGSVAAALPSLTSNRNAGAWQSTGDISGLFDIGDGRRMFIQSAGQGDPTVVFLAGYGNTGGAFKVLPDEVPGPSVYDGVAAMTRIATYDRPGTVLESDPPDDRSRSDPIEQPTTVEAAVADLRALLEAAELPGPYVMVGHSFGGLLSRLYAAIYPDDVVGMVLIDPFTEMIRTSLGPEHWATWQSTNGVLPEDYLAAHPETERFDINAAADAMERALVAQPLRQMPLFSLSAGLTGEMTDEQIGASPAGFPEALQAALDASAEFLANLLPDARHLLVADSHHYIQAEKPEIVIDAIRQVIDAVRNSGAWLSAREGALR